MILGWTDGTQSLDGYVWGGGADISAGVGAPFDQVIVQASRTLAADGVAQRTFALELGDSRVLAVATSDRGTFVLDIAASKTLTVTSTTRRTLHLQVASKEVPE